MRKIEKFSEATFKSAEKWIRRLAEETGGFEVTRVTEDVGAKRSDRRQWEWDYVITASLKSNHRQFKFFVEETQQISPQTALGIFEYAKWVPLDGIFLICAPYISPRVAELCREHNVAFLDGVGNCRINAPGLFVEVSGRPNRKVSKKSAIDPFSRKSSRIVRTLLQFPEKGWQVQQLAHDADVSLGLVSKVKNTLLDEAYLEERDRLLFLRDPAKLLQNWAAQYRPHVRRLQLFAISRPPETETRLAEWCRANGVTYALTQLSAAWRYSPMVRYDKSVVYIDRKAESGAVLKALLGDLDAREVDTGANCTLWITDDPAVFLESREIDGVNAVSPIQLFLDLKALAGRGEDAAQEILEKELHALLPDARRENEKPQGEVK